MGKAADVFKSPGSALPISRVVFMGVLLVLVVTAMLAARAGLFRPRAQAPAPEAEADPSPAPKTHPGGTRVKTIDNGTVGLDVSGTKSILPPASPVADNGLYSAVRDGTTVTFDERAAYYATAQAAWELSQSPPAEPPPLVSRNELVAAPAEYRGKLVRVRGSLVRVRPQTFDPDPEHPDRPTLYYECALKLVNEDLSIVNVFRNPLDNGINPSQGVVTADGYFFKIWGYNDDTLKAPLIMGLQLVKEKADTRLAPVAGLLVGLFVGLVLVVWFFVRRGTRQAAEIRDRLKNVRADDLYIPEPRSLPRDKAYEEREKPAKPPEGQ